VEIHSRAAFTSVDAKEEEFSQRHAALQEQLDEAQSLQAEDDDGEQGQEPQDPEPANGDIAGRDGDDNGNNILGPAI